MKIYGFYLVMKCFAINWASSSSSSGWITSLDHKIRNNSMENQSIVISSTTQFCEISARVRRMIPIQFDGQGTHGRFHVDEWRLPVFWRNTGHLEKIQWIDFLFIWIFYQWRRIFGDRNPRDQIDGQSGPLIPFERQEGLLPKCNFWRAVGDIWKSL